MWNTYELKNTDIPLNKLVGVSRNINTLKGLTQAVPLTYPVSDVPSTNMLTYRFQYRILHSNEQNVETT